MSDKQNEFIAKTLKDAKLKADLLKSPNETIEKTAGVKIPSGMTVKVLEDTATLVHLVLPMTVKAEKGELSDKDLAAVSGGAAASTQVRMCLDSTHGSGPCIA